jgi:hypothetical protein
MLCGVSLWFNVLCDEELGAVSDKRSPEDRELLVGVQATEALCASIPAAVQRSAIAAFCHRFTLQQTRRTVPIMSTHPVKLSITHCPSSNALRQMAV